MKLAIMQPYFVPYFGYFQLINAVDKFVLYNDVSYIKQGWVNRNRLLINKTESFITIPLDNSSTNQLISETKINKQLLPKWLSRTKRSFEQSYSKAPEYLSIKKLVFQLMDELKQFYTIDEFNEYSLSTVCKFIGITTPILNSKDEYYNSYLKSKERVVDICKQEKADVYINPAGGKELYSKHFFAEKKIDLKFLKMNDLGEDFNYSVLHVLANYPLHEVRDYLNHYQLT